MTTAMPATDYSNYVRTDADGTNHLRLIVEGMHCAGCAFKIEKALNANNGVEARVNVTEKRLSLVWAGDKMAGNDLLGRAETLGFRFSPLKQAGTEDAGLKHLLRCIAVSGFASGNLMVFSMALWFSGKGSMGGATRDLMHWYSALITLPTVIYAGMPFFKSAWHALRHGRTNMDVPISVAVVLASAVSLYETFQSSEHAYFDSVAMLLFLLLIGRYLDARVRAQARSAASDLLQTMQGTASVIEDTGHIRRIPSDTLMPGMRLHMAKGEKMLADGIAIGASSVDTAAITGETLPRAVAAGDAVLAGMINMGAPLEIRIDKTQQSSLIGDIISLMQRAEQGGAAYVRIADRIARWYTPVVHALALVTFLGWWGTGASAFQPAMMCAVTVLIITCPCALGLAVPVAQVMAGGRLFRRGMLLKSADALERLEKIDTIVFDKTGTLTTGHIVMDAPDHLDVSAQAHIAGLAAASAHPLARAVAMQMPSAPAENTVEIDGRGIEAMLPDGRWQRLGSAAFLGVPASPDDDKMELWYGVQGVAPVRLTFSDRPHADAARVIADLRKKYRVVLLSGDRPAAAASVAAQLGIDEWYGAVDPLRKHDMIDAEMNAGHRVLMVGDGLNDAAALSRATVSMSPSSALDIAQNAADVVYQRAGLSSVADVLSIAARTQAVVRQSFGLALGYNVIAVPLAMAGFVTPLVAAVSMSLSSLLVVGNALRLKGE